MPAPGPARTLIHPVFPPQLEARARETLSVILMQLGALPGARPEHLEGLRICVNVMADAILEGPGLLFDPSDPVQLREHQYAHPARVAQLAMLLTHLAGGQRPHMRAAGTASLLMNVGYAKMRATDVESEEAFGSEQLLQMRPHPQLSVKLLRHSGLPQDVLDAILQHHERWDGSGYPQGLRKSQISPIARVVAAADVYVALCSPRFQRKPYARQQVEAFFTGASGTQFDPRVVRVLLEDLPGAVLFEAPLED